MGRTADIVGGVRLFAQLERGKIGRQEGRWLDGRGARRQRQLGP